MYLMVVTLEVSKLSGWLNVDAYCRETKEGRAMRGEVRAGPGSRRSVRLRRRKERAGKRTKNMPDMIVTLEVSRLSAWLNVDALCRVERKACGVG